MRVWALRIGAAYFFAVAVAHWIGFKAPGLFIYYNIPSNTYQDRGIGTLSLGWAIFIWVASKHAELVPAVLVAGASALAGFALITLTPEIAGLAPQGLMPYWTQLFFHALYLGWVAWAWRQGK